ncbi:MAG: class I SAM-dependent methyltransferase [Candidatus Azobacteroides sp.]|nr:class I SAM-dependent methyltransferase [Candidatus Azobacteroides sp.]
MNTLKNQIKNIWWKYWMLRGIHSLKYSEGSANKIKQAIRETVHHRINPEEKAWISRIEEIRKQFTGNRAAITILDYGAGNPDSRRSEEEMTRGKASATTYGEISMGSKPALWALLLFKLIRAMQPETAVELGTCIGISAAYQSAALQLNGKGSLITIEGSEAIAGLAKKNLESLNLQKVEIRCGTFKTVLPEIFAKTSTLDYVFVDGHHDEQATIAYFELLLPHLSPGALLVFDDISWSSGMRRAWEKIRKHSAISFSADLKMLGICQI